MKQRKYLDCFGMVGRPAIPNRDFPYEVKDMLSDMEYARVHGAVLLHNYAWDFSFDEGNDKMIELAKENPRIFPLALATASSCYECGNLNYYKEILEKGAKGIVAPASRRLYEFLLLKDFRKIAEALIEKDLPFIVTDMVSEDHYIKIGDIAKEYPDLKIIMQGTRWTSNRLFTGAMENYKNLHFEISQNHSNGILELTKEYFGIERAVFSSQWPLRSMGAIKSIVEYSYLSEEEKDMVAYKNACNLFKIDPESLVLYDDKDLKLDEIAKEMDQGLPVSVPVIDMHTHGSMKKRALNMAFELNITYDKMIKKMDQLGIDKIITAPDIGVEYDGNMGNDESIDAYNKFDKRILGYGCCNVNFEDNLCSIEKYHEKYPDILVGIKPYPPMFDFDFRDEVCAPWFSYANEHHLPALIHADSTVWGEQIDEIADKYPNITFILAHSGASYEIARFNSSIAKKHKNIVVDITFTNTGRGIVEFLVSELGADRVLYGSDMPLRDPAPQLGWVCYAKLSVEDKKKILAGNIERILSKRK